MQRDVAMVLPRQTLGELHRENSAAGLDYLDITIPARPRYMGWSECIMCMQSRVSKGSCVEGAAHPDAAAAEAAPTSGAGTANTTEE